MINLREMKNELDAMIEEREAMDERDTTMEELSDMDYRIDEQYKDIANVILQDDNILKMVQDYLET